MRGKAVRQMTDSIKNGSFTWKMKQVIRHSLQAVSPSMTINWQAPTQWYESHHLYVYNSTLVCRSVTHRGELVIYIPLHMHRLQHCSVERIGTS